MKIFRINIAKIRVKCFTKIFFLRISYLKETLAFSGRKTGIFKNLWPNFLCSFSIYLFIYNLSYDPHQKFLIIIGIFEDVRLANSKARIKPTAPLLAFDKKNLIEFLLDSVHYLYNRSNPNPVLSPTLPYESTCSRTSVDITN